MQFFSQILWRTAGSTSLGMEDGAVSTITIALNPYAFLAKTSKTNNGGTLNIYFSRKKSLTRQYNFIGVIFV